MNRRYSRAPANCIAGHVPRQSIPGHNGRFELFHTVAIIVSIVAPLQNFGQNVTIRPVAYYEPRDEEEVASLLARHRGQSIRVMGRRHSWSRAIEGDGVVLSLWKMKHVEIRRGADPDSEQTHVTVGAGCQIKSLLKQLHQSGWTLPSVGLINEQTIAGAISTGTHGSGRHSLAHYVVSVKVARFDSNTGEVVIEHLNDGDNLRAARCSLGCLGVILSVTMQCRKAYGIEEHLREYQTLPQVLEAEATYPLQQFFLIPWRWNYLAQHRREVSSSRSKLAWLYRLYWWASIDIGLHLLIVGTLRLLGSIRPIQFLYKSVIPWTVIYHWKVIDDSAAMLVMEHELFRHIEMEIFVRREFLSAALDHVRHVLTIAGAASRKPASNGASPARIEELRGRYGHHYPICIRRVMRDDTLISMSSSGQDGKSPASDNDSDWFAISLISYARPSERQGFFDVMGYLAETMSIEFGARPHWGKLCPLPAKSLVALYPRFCDFRRICTERDPTGSFRNSWLSELLSCSPDEPASERLSVPNACG